jgi:hypothetical protein
VETQIENLPLHFEIDFREPMKIAHFRRVSALIALETVEDGPKQRFNTLRGGGSPDLLPLAKRLKARKWGAVEQVLWGVWVG